jgi:hypothetical protein
LKYSNSIWDVKFVGLDVDFEEILSFHIAIHFLIFAPVFYLHSESKASIVGGNPFSDKDFLLSLVLISSQFIISSARETGVAGVKAFYA